MAIHLDSVAYETSPSSEYHGDRQTKIPFNVPFQKIQYNALQQNALQHKQTDLYNTYQTPKLVSTVHTAPLSDQYVPYDLTQFTESDDDDSSDSISVGASSTSLDLTFSYTSKRKSYSTPLFEDEPTSGIEIKPPTPSKAIATSQSIPIRRGSSFRPVKFRRSFVDLRSESLESESSSPLSESGFKRGFRTTPFTSSYTANRSTVYTHRLSISKSAIAIPALVSSSCSPPLVVSSSPITSVSSTSVHSQLIPTSKVSNKTSEGLSDILAKTADKTTPLVQETFLPEMPLVSSKQSNLTTKIKSWNLSSSWLNMYSNSPRMTYDTVPQNFKQGFEDETARELTTFSPHKAKPPLLCDDSADELAKLVARRSFKNRDQRINSQFLRLYAMDFNARTVAHTLPNSNDVQELNHMISQRPNLKQFHYKHNLFRISSMSRDKLWSSVILDPRTDPSPTAAINDEAYINSHSTNSIVRQNGAHVPWTGSKGMKPVGIHEGGKVLENGLAPNSGVTRTQYVVVGWCSQKWMSSH